MEAILIGIDPGLNTGVAIWDRSQQKIINAYTFTFWETINYLQESIGLWAYTVIIEDPTQNKPVFARKGANTFEMQRIAQNVGSNKRDAQLLMEFCELKGVELVKVKPTKEKWTHEYCMQISRYEKRVSQHARDAIRLIAGR